MAIERFFNSRLRLSQIRLLAAAGELSQLRQVAEALSVTPAAVSKQLAEIEAALQRPVVRRVGNRVELTDIGKVLARRSRELLDHLDRVRVEVDELCAGVSGRLGIGAVPSVAPLLLPPLVIALKEQAPNIDVRLQQGLFDRLAPKLADGTIDLALARETAHVAMDGLRWESVVDDPLVVVCGSQHPIARRQTLHWSDLDGVPWLLPVNGTPTFNHLRQLVNRHGITFGPGSVECNSWQVNVALLKSSPFVTVMPRAYARQMSAGALTLLSLSTEGIQMAVKAVWREDNENPAIGMLLSVLRQQASLL